MAPLREDIERRLAAALEREAPDIAAAYLFGSTARGEARDDSDVDLALLFGDEAPSTWQALDLEGKLEKAVGRPLQLIVLDRAPVDLVHRVLRDGRILVENDSSNRIAFEVRARAEYFDLVPHLLRYRGIRESHG